MTRKDGIRLSGDEEDVFSRAARRLHGMGRGMAKAVKRRYNKRLRRQKTWRDQ